MRTDKLENMIKGWFVGAFSPAVYNTNDVEVGVKRYVKGDRESAHYHKIATEVTVIIEGNVRMNGRCYGAGEIIVLEPGDISDFIADEDAITVVVKHPGALEDKYVVG